MSLRLPPKISLRHEWTRELGSNMLLVMTIWVLSKQCWTRQTWTSEFQDYHVPLWNTRKVPAFDNWFIKLRTTQIDMLFNKIYDRIKQLILSVQNQNEWFGMLETSNCVNCPRRNPTRSAKYVYHTGTTLASYIARAGTSCVKEEERISNSSSIRWTFSQFLSTSSRKDDFTDIGWLHSNKTGSNTVPVKHRPDFKEALSTLQQLKQKEGALRTSKNSRRNQQWAQSSSSLFMVELARFMVDSLFLWKSRWRWTKYWQNRVTCCTSIWNKSSGHDFLEFICFVTDGSFTADVGLL